MAELSQGPSPVVDPRIRRLERRLTIVSVAFISYAVISVGVYLYDQRAHRRAFWSTSLFASELHIPRPSLSDKVSGGIATDTDGKSITLWLSAGVLSSLRDPRSSRQQIRLGLDEAGAEHLAFYDRSGHVRLRLTLSAEGEPSIALLAANGATVWSTGGLPR